MVINWKEWKPPQDEREKWILKSTPFKHEIRYNLNGEGKKQTSRDLHSILATLVRSHLPHQFFHYSTQKYYELGLKSIYFKLLGWPTPTLWHIIRLEKSQKRARTRERARERDKLRWRRRQERRRVRGRWPKNVVCWLMKVEQIYRFFSPLHPIQSRNLVQYVKRPISTLICTCIQRQNSSLSFFLYHLRD